MKRVEAEKDVKKTLKNIEGNQFAADISFLNEIAAATALIIASRENLPQQANQDEAAAV